MKYEMIIPIITTWFEIILAKKCYRFYNGEVITLNNGQEVSREV